MALALTSRKGSLERLVRVCKVKVNAHSRSDVIQPIVVTLAGKWRKLTLALSQLIPMDILSDNILPHPLLLLSYGRGQYVDHGCARLHTENGENMSLRLHPIGPSGGERIVCVKLVS